MQPWSRPPNLQLRRRSPPSSGPGSAKSPPRGSSSSPSPGRATEADVIAARRPCLSDGICELVEGVLIMKAPGFYQAVLSPIFASHFFDFLKDEHSGIIVGASAMMRLKPGLVRVRVHDIAYPFLGKPSRSPDSARGDPFRDARSGSRHPPRRKHRGGDATQGPRLFRSGNKEGLAPRNTDDHSVRLYTSPDQFTRLDESQTLDGGEVLH